MSFFEEAQTIINELRTIGMQSEADNLQKDLEIFAEKDLTRFRIVVAGQYNSGKSSLLNALCESLNPEMELFKTGDIPVTRDAQEEAYEDAIYVDTPGYGTNAEDHDTAESVWRTASVIVFVHSMRGSAEFNLEEKKEFEHICALMKDPKRVLVALSHAGQVSADDAFIIQKAVHEQLQVTELKILCVDSCDYLDGKRDDEAGLVHSSGVLVVRGWLNERNDLRCMAVENLCALFAKYIPELEAKQDGLQKILKGLHDKVASLYSQCIDVLRSNVGPDSSFASTWKAVFDCEKEVNKYQ